MSQQQSVTGGRTCNQQLYNEYITDQAPSKRSKAIQYQTNTGNTQEDFCDKNKDKKGTHGISLAKALKASAKVSVLVSMDTPRPSTATAPRGRGVVMIPTMVPAKMASRFLGKQADKADRREW
jgi:hypothetical protein